MSELFGEKRDYRAAGLALCSAVVGVIIMRIIVYYVPTDGTYGGSLASDALFSLPAQLLFFLGVPFCIFKFYGKRTVKQTLKYSGFGVFKPYYLLALPLGFCVFILTLGVSSAWSRLLELTGYVSPTASPDMPENFVFGFLLAEIVMTAALPAVCEEFCMRGGVLSTVRKTFGTVGCVIFCGIAFGLFHQNVRQVFYTALFGASAAFITLRLKSIYPAVLMHFTNNFCSVFFNYANEYDFAVGGGFYSTIDMMADRYAWALILIYIAAAAAAFGLVFLMLYLREKRVIANKTEVIKDSAFDATNKRVVLMGEFDPERIENLEMEREVYGAGYAKEKFKPSARDLAFIIAAGVTSLLTTVFTYVFGFFY